MTSLTSLPSFTRHQLECTQALGRTATESVVASVLDLTVCQLRQWRHDGVGPDYETTVSGQTIYRREAVREFVRSHLSQVR